MREGFLAVMLCLGMTLGTAGAFAAGAIAVDDEEGVKAGDVGYGIGTGDSREAAGKDAIKECKKAGNASCQVVVRYDTCGAYAVSKKETGVGWGASEAEAVANAMEACGAGCKLVVSDCQ